MKKTKKKKCSTKIIKRVITMKKTYFRKRLIIFAACLTAFCLLSGFWCTVSYAYVKTTEDPTGPAEDVYIAGNPDAYPVEYYDTKSDTYKGVIPDILEMVSEETGINFMYVSADTENRQNQMATNKQVDMVTAIQARERTMPLADSIVALTVVNDNMKTYYYIGFTDIAPADTVSKIKAAIENISDEQKKGMLLSYAQESHSQNLRLRWAVVGAIVLGAALIGLIVLMTILGFKKRKAKQDELIDPITGAGNGDYYVYFFNNFIEGQARNLFCISYFAFDTEEFAQKWGEKTITDIEQYAAAHISAKLGAVESISRIQEGTFAVCFQADNDEQFNTRMTELINSLNVYLNSLNTAWVDIFNAGACQLREYPDCNAETSLYNAKQAYYYAKAKNLGYYVGSKSNLASIRKNQKLRASLKQAFENNEFEIYLQFIADGKSDKFIGAEVLTRWQTTEYGLLRPNFYFDILKEDDKIIDYDYHIFDRVCAQLEKWNKHPFDKFLLSCNFTRYSISQQDFVENLTKIAKKHNFDYSKMVIEITEDSLTYNSDLVSSNIRKCRESGFKVAIDDLGTGFSSLADLYLNDIDAVKIERTFTTNYTSERRMKMLKDIISLVHNTGAEIVCEGIETQEQFEAMKKVGCDKYQGYFFSRVLPLSECDAFLSDNEEKLPDK